MRVDGTFADWADLGDATAIADADYLYLRLSVASEEVSLQSGGEMFSIWLDVDDNPRTGRRVGTPSAAATLGTDLEVRFSPVAEGRVQSGAAVLVFGADGRPLPVSPYAVDVVASPTHAAAWFELRISRHLDGLEGLPRQGLRSSGRMAGLYVLSDGRGEATGWSEAPFTLELPARAGAAPRGSARIPTRHPDTVRVVSFNVLRGAPGANRRPFAHLLQALDPDIVLVQEWDAPAEEIQAWFAALMGGPRVSWQVRKSAGLGVAIVSRHPISPLGPDHLSLADAGAERAGEAIRFVGGIVNSPSGDVAVASVHLKCCGSPGSREDLARIDQARAVREALAEAFSGVMTPLRIVGGDLNLVGSRAPLELLAEALDVDGSSLVPADAAVLGDAITATWSDPASAFPPGRLDWLLVGDARARIINAFVLDTTRLDDASLAAMGLDREDSLASDHRPLVVDVSPAR